MAPSRSLWHYGMQPYCGHFEVRIQFQSLDHMGNRLAHLESG